MELKKVDYKNLWPITKLSVQDSQKEFVATNTESILEAYVTITSGAVALPFGLYENGILVGFLTNRKIPWHGSFIIRSDSRRTGKCVMAKWLRYESYKWEI